MKPDDHPAVDDAAVAAAGLPAIFAAPNLELARQPAPVATDDLGSSRRAWLQRWYWYLVPVVLVGVDVLSLMIAAMLAGFAWEVGLMAIPMVVLFNALGRLYRWRLTLAVLDEAPIIVGRGFIAITLTSALVSLGDWLSPLELGAGLLLTVVSYSLLTVGGRAGVYAVVRRVRARRLLTHRTLVIGAGRVGKQVVHTLLDHPEYGLAPIGFLDERRTPATEQLPLPLLGVVRDLAGVVSSFDVHHVLITFGRFKDADLVEIIRTCTQLGCEVLVVPRFFELNVLTGPLTDDVFGFPCLRLRNLSRRSPSWLVKRVMDTVAAALALVIASPIMIVCAIAVRVETGPGVLFRQKRIGLDGQEFVLLKFRTLQPSTMEESETTWNIAHDGRLGKVGRFLRKTSLDELPQLWNVIMGEMSLVGPRPERPHFVTQFNETFSGYTDRHRVPVGITGWAQIHGLRGDTSIEDRVRFDNQYIERWSLWQDIKIILRTLMSLLRPRGMR